MVYDFVSVGVYELAFIRKAVFEAQKVFLTSVLTLLAGSGSCSVQYHWKTEAFLMRRLSRRSFRAVYAVLCGCLCMRERWTPSADYANYAPSIRQSEALSCGTFTEVASTHFHVARKRSRFFRRQFQNPKPQLVVETLRRPRTQHSQSRARQRSSVRAKQILNRSIFRILNVCLMNVSILFQWH